MSLFTLGTMRALASVEQMTTVLKAAVAAGINHIETAPAYGPAEAFLGTALADTHQNGIEPEGGWVVTSKIIPGCTLAEGQRQLKGTLKRLGVSQLDNLAVHGINREEHLRWAVEGDGATLLDWALKQGLVTQIGFSSHGADPVIAAALQSGRFSFCSLHLHLLDQQRFPLAREALNLGMGVMAISPADKGGRLQAPSDTLREDCAPMEPLALAYRFLLAQGITTLTLGAAAPSDLDLARTLQRADGPLGDDETRVIHHLEHQRHERLGVDQCHQCRACLPCPQQVPIPDLLRLRNLAIGHDLMGFAQERYNLIGRAGHWWEAVDGSACIGCGDCLPRCPHQLAIPELLADAHKRLKAAPRRRLWS